MSYSLPVNANSRNTFLFVKDNAGNWVPAQSGDIGADKWAVKTTGYNGVSGNKDFFGTLNFSGTGYFHKQVNFGADVEVSGHFTAQGAHFNDDVFMTYLEVNEDFVQGINANDQRYVLKTEHFFRTTNTNSGAVTLGLGNISGYYRIGNNSGCVVTVPTQASVSWPTEVEIQFCQGLSGQISFTGASGVTINSSESYKTARQYSVVLLKKVATNTWDLIGERELA